jgi:hypothetical protein
MVLATLALVIASSGTAIAAASPSNVTQSIPTPNTMNVVQTDVAHAATTGIAKPRRRDGSPLPRLGRYSRPASAHPIGPGGSTLTRIVRRELESRHPGALQPPPPAAGPESSPLRLAKAADCARSGWSFPSATDAA